jgi:hypothetical protein
MLESLSQEENHKVYQYLKMQLEIYDNPFVSGRKQ